MRLERDVMADESRLTSKGRTTIPRAIRDRLAMKSGDRIVFTLLPNGTVLIRVRNKSISGLAGSLRTKGQKRVPIKHLSL